MPFDPIALGVLTSQDLGFLMGLAGIICGLIVVYALLSNI